ncbi:MAG TPA: hypothetical protein PLQ76_01405 [bacterium]|nr:hypothetical protein [bacterium]
MWPLVVNILRFGFTMVLVFVMNYILFAGLKELIYFLFPIGPPTLPRLKAIRASDVLKLSTAKKVVFWAMFVPIAIFLINFILPFTACILFAYILFGYAERKALKPGRLLFLTSILVMIVTFAFVKSQPVLMRIDSQFSADLWIYNASNSLIDVLISAAQSLGLPTAPVERLAALVPVVQRNMFVLLYLSLYFFCGVTINKLIGMILPDSKYTAPVYYEIAPDRMLGVLSIAALVAARYLNAPQLSFVVAGLYYLTGINAIVYFLRGGWWPINAFIVAAGTLNPAVAAIFIAVGVLDNLFDLRRAASVLGFEIRPA